MQTHMLLTGLALVGILVPRLGTADTSTIPYKSDTNNEGILTFRPEREGPLETTITLQENGEIIFAEFHYEDALPLGTELEIWPILEGDKQAWELETPPFERNLWIMDERTGTLVRFDVTLIVRAWQRGDLPDLGIVVRVVDTGAEATQAVSELSLNPKGAAIVTHVAPAWILKKLAHPPDKGQEPSGKTPRSEGGGGGSE